MIKKFFSGIFSAAIIFAAIAGFFYYQQQKQEKLARQTAKAPQTSVTFLPGWSESDIAKYLQDKNIINAKDFLAETKSYDTGTTTNLFLKPSGQSLEGYLYPDTYFIPQTPKPGQDIGEIIIKKSLDNFVGKVAPLLPQRKADNSYSFYQILTLASIVQKESGSSPGEQALIAGIFYNRLKAGMPLESDATINYATKKNLAQPTGPDLLINSPYNTYKYKGLPPGPICNPTAEAILAALNPTPSNYFFFLHDQSSGQVYYAATYDQHLLNKQKYLR